MTEDDYYDKQLELELEELRVTKEKLKLELEKSIERTNLMINAIELAEKAAKDLKKNK